MNPFRSRASELFLLRRLKTPATFAGLSISRPLLLMAALALTAACSQEASSSAEQATQASGAAATALESPIDPGSVDQAMENRPSLEQLQKKLGLKVMTDAWSGDLDGMMKRRVIRVLTVYGLGRYFIDGAQEHGVAFESMKAFETALNKGLDTVEQVNMIFIPVSRDQLIPGLLEGRGDIIVAGMTITPERQELVDFSLPVSKPLKEILVTGPSAPGIQSVDDLSGQSIHVRESSSYYTSLMDLSRRLESKGKAAIDIQPISELLEDEDLLEMVSAGLLPWIVVDDYKAEIFKEVFAGLVVRNDLVVREGGQLAYAFRKDSPQFAAAVNEYVKGHKVGTLFGNILVNRYIRDFDWVDNALDTEDYGRFEDVVNIFKKYGEQYGMDYLLVAAQGYQESQLNQDARSKAGAIGIMQLLPATAADENVGIPDITTKDSNIHAGIRYLDFIRDRYFSDPEIDPVNQTLLAMASYNAGPNRIQSLRKKAAAQGLDPNKWFGNVEVVTAREVGREPVKYVANIYKYYITYRMTAMQVTARAEERKRQGVE